MGCKISEKFEDFAVSSAGLTGVRKNRVRDALNGTRLKLCGALFPIFFKHRLIERHQTSGQTDLYNENILIEGNLTEAETLSSIYHEMLEVVNKKYILGLDHDLLTKLESNTFEALVNNPAYLQELLIYSKKYNNAKQTTKKVKK